MPTIQKQDDFNHVINSSYYTDAFFEAGANDPERVTSPRYGDQPASLLIHSEGSNTGPRWNITGSPTLGWMAFPFRLETLPTGADMTISALLPAAGAQARIAVGTGGGSYAYVGGGTPQNGPTFVADKWYWIEMIYDVSGATASLYWRVDGVNQTTATVAQTASTITASQLVSLVGNGTADWYAGWWGLGSAASTSDWLGANYLPFNLYNTFESGSDETAITTGNSGGSFNNAFDFTEGTVTFDTAQAQQGSLSGRVNIVTSGFDNFQWRSSIPSPMSQLWTRFYVYLTANPSNTVRLMSWANSALSRRASIELQSSGLLRMSDADFAATDTQLAIPLNQWVRIEARCFSNATTGQIEIRVYAGDNISPQEIRYTPATRNTGTGDLQLVGFGQLVDNAQTTTFWMDGLNVNNSGFPGPTVLPAANNFEGGSDEVVISPVNSGGASGTNFGRVTIQSPQNVLYDTARASHGGVSSRFDLSDSANIVSYTWIFPGVTQAWGRIYVYLTGAWTGPSTLRILGWESSEPLANGRLNIGRDARTIQVLDADFAFGATSTAAIAFNAWHRIEWRVLASPTAGEIEARLYEGDSPTPLPGGTIQTTAGANTKSDIGRVSIGSNQTWAGGSTYSYWVDSPQVNNTGFPGPLIIPFPFVNMATAPLKW